jgi:DNA-binding NtrC family response regulator
VVKPPRDFNIKDGGAYMQSTSDGKRILAVDDEPDVLALLEEEIKQEWPNWTVEKATTYEKANEMLKSNEYDLVILDIMGVKGFDLLDTAVSRKFRVAIFTARALSSEDLKRSYDAGAYAYIPKDKMGEMVSYLWVALTYDREPGWRELLGRLEGYFNDKFEPGWNRPLQG